MSQRAAISVPGTRGKPLMWSVPRPRVPQMATRTRSLAPRILPPRANAAAPAVMALPVVFRNSRRSMVIVAAFALEGISATRHYIPAARGTNILLPFELAEGLREFV